MRIFVVSARRHFAGAPIVLGLVAVGLASSTLRGEPLVEWTQSIEVATGGGHRGPWEMNRSDFDYVDDPTVAMTRSGRVAIVWADQAEQDLFLQIYSPDGRKDLETPVNLSRSPDTFSWLPRVKVIDGEPLEVLVLWQEIVFSGGSHGGEIFFTRWKEGADAAHNPVNLSKTPAGAGKGRITEDFWHNGSLDLALGREGNIYAAWTTYEGGLWFSRSEDDGAQFSQPERLAGGYDENPARGPSLAVGPEGDLHLAWTVGENASGNLHYTTSRNDGKCWEEPVITIDSPGFADAPALAVSADATVYLVYAESPEGPFGPSHLRFTRMEPDDNTFETPRRIADRPTNRFVRAGFPELASNENGRLVLLWALATRVDGRAEALALTVSHEGGREFEPPVLIPGSTEAEAAFHGSQQGMFMQKLAVGPDNRIAVGNSTFRAGVGSIVQLHLGTLTHRRPDVDGSRSN